MTLALIGFTVAAALVRESLLTLPLALLAVRDQRRRALLALGAGLLVQLWIRGSVDTTGEYSAVLTAVYWLYAKVQHPVALLLSPLEAFGFIVLLLVARRHESLTFLRQHPALTTYAGLCVALAVVAGSDTARLLSWSFPVVYVLVGRVLCSDSSHSM